MPRLLVKFKDKVISEYRLYKGAPITIGRLKENNIVIDNPGVSGQHARIAIDARGWVLKDLGSKNGTFINEKPVKTHLLNIGDVITIGRHIIVYNDDSATTHTADNFRNVASQPFSEADYTMFMETRDFKKMLLQSAPEKVKQKPTAFVRFLIGGKGTVELSKGIITIGKGRESDIVVQGFLSYFVGYLAATISKTPENYYISSVKGLIKAKVNNERIKGSVRLRNRDIIKVGPLILQYFSGDSNHR